MTDLISSLADSIIALINAKPASPSKDEVVEVVRKHYDAVMRMMLDPQLLASYPMFVVRKARAAEEIKVGNPVVFDRPAEVATACLHHWSHYPDNPQSAVPRPYCLNCGLDIDNRPSPLFKRPASTPSDRNLEGEAAPTDAEYIRKAQQANAALLAASAEFTRQMERRAADIFNAFTPEQKALEPCQGYASELHYWEVDPFSTRETRPDEVANRCACGALKP